MIRSSKHHITETNKSKLDLLNQTYELYRQDLKFYIDLIIKGILPYDKLVSSKDIPTNRLIKSAWKISCFKQAQEIVKSNIDKIKNKRFRKYKKLYSFCIVKGIHKSFTDKRYSELNLNHVRYIKIDIKNITIPFNYMMLSTIKGNICYDKTKYFDNFIGINSQLGSVHIPYKEHRVSLKYKDWNKKKTIGLSKDQKNRFYILQYYEKEEPIKLDNRNSLGIDLGVKKLISTSDGRFYGKELENEYTKLTNKVRGSKNYNQQLKHKNDLINQTVNNFINDYHIGKLVCEDLYQLRHESKLGHKQLNIQQYFTYSNVLKRLEYICQERGIEMLKVSPAYTSVTCSKCRKIDKSARDGEIYRCSCGFLMDADTNAAINIHNRGVYKPSTKETLFLVGLAIK